VPEPSRPHDVRAMTTAELEQARRDLQVSFALATAGSAVAVPIRARTAAIDAELASRQPDGLADSPLL
jgi:hypothetical protein